MSSCVDAPFRSLKKDTPQRHTLPRRATAVATSKSSHEPWRPPSKWRADPPNRLYGLLYASVAALFTLIYVVMFAHIMKYGDSNVSFWQRLVSPGELPLFLRVIPVTIGVFVYEILRRLEPVGYAQMLAAEEAILCTVSGDVQHHWNKFSTAHATWHIHSLLMKCDSNPPGLNDWQKPALVFIHGHSAGAAHWEAVLDSLCELADLYVIDMPGWGRSPLPRALEKCNQPSEIASLHCEMLHGWMQANNLKQVTLVGHSFGGFHSVQFASRFPHLVSQVILVSPAGITPVMPEGAIKWGALFRFAPPQWIARTFGRLAFVIFKTLYLRFTNEDPRFPDFYYQLAAQTASTGYGDQVAAKFMKFDHLGNLWWAQPCLSDIMSLDMPVSVVWGQRDDMLPPIFGPVLHRIRPHTDLYLIKDAMHNPAHNNPRAFCDAIADCLLKYRSGPRITVKGRGDGRDFSDGTAHKLLEPTAQASSASKHFDFTPPIKVMPYEGSQYAVAEFVRRSPLNRIEPSEDASSETFEGAENVIDDVSGSRPSSVRSRLSQSLDPELRLLDTPTSVGSPLSRENATFDQLLCSLPPPATPHTFTRLSRGDSLADGTHPGECRGAVSKNHSIAPQPTKITARQRGLSWQGHDGLTSDFGCGRGYCSACCRKVVLHKSYWRCACAAWSFNAHVSNATTRAHFHKLLQFLDELYVYGTFNGRTSKTIVKYLRVKTPLPAEPPKALQTALSLSSMMNPPASPAQSTSTRSSTAPELTEEDLQQGGNDVLLPPTVECFPRGEVYLLD